jgi:hypothetical protein
LKRTLKQLLSAIAIAPALAAVDTNRTGDKESKTYTAKAVLLI